MKKTLLSLLAGLAGVFTVNAQVQDFTATDKSGKTWNLYETLNSGKMVVLDIGFASCAACVWYHNQGYLESFNTMFGEGGENTVQVMLANSQGSSFSGWSDHGSYPVFEGSGGADIANKFTAVRGYPAIYVICPDKSVADNDAYDYGQNPLSSEEEIRAHMATCSVVTGKDDVSKADQKLRVYPNPATDKVNITVSGMEEVKVQIIDIMGKVVKEEMVKGALDISDLNAGLYMAKATDLDQTVRFVKK